MFNKNAIMAIATIFMSMSFLSSCKKDSGITAKNISTATKVSVDRFSAAAAHLMVRTATNGLPAANAPINCDQAPFITFGLDRTGAKVVYYNFDVQSTTPDDIYVLVKSDGSAVAGQNNIVPTIPGDMGYNDFWLVNKVTVPDNYVANSLTSEAGVLASGYPIVKTSTIVNCPVVPFGSTAARSSVAGQASTLTIGWYKDQAVAYFNFGEAPLMAVNGLVPTSPIYVMFVKNPVATDPTSGPASGFMTEAETNQTHNVIATLPGDTGYSPLWNVQVINNTNFAGVTNLSTAISFPYSPAGATVNCPVVK